MVTNYKKCSTEQSLIVTVVIGTADNIYCNNTVTFSVTCHVLPVAVCVTTFCSDVYNYTAVLYVCMYVCMYVYIYIYIYIYIKEKVKVQFTLEQATKVQTGSRGTALLFS